MIREYTLPDGSKKHHGEPFAIPDVARFPPNWLQNASGQDLAQFSISVADIADPTSTVTVEEVYKTYAKMLENDAEDIRLRYITPGAGKSLSYREVQSEALEILSDPAAADALTTQASTDPSFSNLAEETYPVIYPDVGIQAATLSACAAIVAAQAEAFQKVENAIKKIVYAGKAAIEASATEDDVKAAYAAVSWGLL